MQTSLSQPTGFKPGVYVIKVELDAGEREQVGKDPIRFDVPDLNGWFFRDFETDPLKREKYAIDRGSLLEAQKHALNRHGLITDGQWIFIVSEQRARDRNLPQVTGDELEQAVGANIQSAIEQRIENLRPRD